MAENIVEDSGFDVDIDGMQMVPDNIERELMVNPALDAKQTLSQTVKAAKPYPAIRQGIPEKTALICRHCYEEYRKAVRKCQVCDSASDVVEIPISEFNAMQLFLKQSVSIPSVPVAKPEAAVPEDETMVEPPADDIGKTVEAFNKTAAIKFANESTEIAVKGFMDYFASLKYETSVWFVNATKQDKVAYIINYLKNQYENVMIKENKAKLISVCDTITKNFGK